jgi:hypothetical protein
MRCVTFGNDARVRCVTSLASTWAPSRRDTDNGGLHATMDPISYRTRVSGLPSGDEMKVTLLCKSYGGASMHWAGASSPVLASIHGAGASSPVLAPRLEQLATRS